MCVRMCLSIALVIQPAAKRHTQFAVWIMKINICFTPFECTQSIQTRSSLYDWHWFISIRFDSNRIGSDRLYEYTLYLLFSIFLWIKLSPQYFSLICRFISSSSNKTNTSKIERKYTFTFFAFLLIFFCGVESFFFLLLFSLFLFFSVLNCPNRLLLYPYT